MCVELHYHMFGSNMGALGIYSPVKENQSFTLLDRKFGNQGAQWTLLKVTVRVKPSSNWVRLVLSLVSATHDVSTRATHGRTGGRAGGRFR